MKNVKELLGAVRINNIVKRLCYLKARWRDESRNEDFGLYIDNISAIVPGASELRLTRKFNFYFRLDGVGIYFEFKDGNIVYGQTTNS